MVHLNHSVRQENHEGVSLPHPIYRRFLSRRFVSILFLPQQHAANAFTLAFTQNAASSEGI
jgi:hypothetical protein